MKKSQFKFLEMKSSSVWDETTLDGINTRLDIAKENTGIEHIEMLQNEHSKKKKKKNISEL